MARTKLRNGETSLEKNSLCAGKFNCKVMAKHNAEREVRFAVCFRPKNEQLDHDMSGASASQGLLYFFWLACSFLTSSL